MELCVASVRAARFFGAAARFFGAALRGFDAGLLAFFGGALRAAPVRDVFDEGLAAAVCFTALRGARRALPAAFFRDGLSRRRSRRCGG